MVNWQLVPALRVALFLALGIASTRLSYLAIHSQLVVLVLLGLTLGILVWPIRFEAKAKYRGLGVLLAALTTGFLLALTNQAPLASTDGAGAKAFIAQLERAPKKSTNWFSVDAKVSSFRTDTGWTKSSSRVRILLPPARVTAEMRTGATYLFNSKLTEINTSSNPHAFNYGDYLNEQGIALQAFAPPISLSQATDHGVILLKKGNPTGIIAKLQGWMARRIELALPTPNEAAVAKALLLGDKSSLSVDTRKNYTRTGAVHVLAVSGLHTGIIASIILWILGLVRWKKELNWLKLILFWAGLFSYAAITDFSPSVQRSAVMFGVLFAGKILKRDPNGFNSLGLSAIILLGLNPQLLFELGFQLSYCAVGGILAFYPSLRKRFASKNYWFNAVGELNAISIAATIGTVPLTIYYFHQFPIYFLLSGIIAVPLVGLALPTLLGAIAIDSLFALLGSSAYWAYFPAYLLIWLCNACLEAIAVFPNAIVAGLWPSITSSVFAIVSIVFLGAAVLRQRKRLYWLALSLGLCWSVAITFQSYDKLKAKQVIVYALKDELIVDAFTAGNILSTEVENGYSLTSRSKDIVNPHRAAMNARLDSTPSILIKTKTSSLEFGLVNGKRFFIISNETPLLALEAPHLDFVLVQDPNSVNPKELTAAFPGATLVLGNRIPAWKEQEWEPHYSKIHDLKSNGAYLLND